MSSEIRLGTPIGLARRGTIRQYHNDGTVTVALDEASLTQNKIEFKTFLPVAWTGSEGEFLGGYPKIGSTVMVEQTMGGAWVVIGYAPSDRTFGNYTSVTQSSYLNNKLSLLKPNRILGQVKNGTYFFLDPEVGFQVGKSNSYFHANPIDNIFSYNFNSSFIFTDSYRSINNTIKRDLTENSNRNLFGYTLNSHSYEKSLFTIGLDPSLATNIASSGVHLRNPPLVENRELIYEFAQSSGYSSDQEEAVKYVDPKNVIKNIKNSRRDNRTDLLSLSLEYPNHLLETIKGTVVDVFGNILDLNRNILPIGKVDSLSLRKNTNKQDAFNKIRAQYRKSIAYHFELNARKGFDDENTMSIPDPEQFTDYARERSRFSVDIDKEGQFKINIPSSSEVGNVPLLTRTENYSVLLSKQDSSNNANSFIRPENSQDLYLESFAGKPTIKLTGSSEDLDGYQSPIDRITDKPIKLGTAFHDITTTCSEFLSTANYLSAGMKLINFDTNNRLNKNWTPLEKIVSDKIIVSGPDANAGGRSGTISLDGFVSLNIGANTIDRQSLWIDCAGGVVANYGRDKRGVSYAGNMDGDVLIQVGGNGIGNTFDTRFADQNDAYRNGTFEIRVINNGAISIVRIGPEGITIASPGTITYTAQQDIIFRTNSNFMVEAENIILFAETSKRMVNRFPNTTIG